MKVNTSLKAGKFVGNAAQQASQLTGLGAGILQSARSQAGMKPDQAAALSQMGGVDIKHASAFLKSFGVPASG